MEFDEKEKNSQENENTNNELEAKKKETSPFDDSFMEQLSEDIKKEKQRNSIVESLSSEPPKKNGKGSFFKGLLLGVVISSAFAGGFYLSDNQSVDRTSSPSITYVKEGKGNDNFVPKNDIAKIVKEKGDAVVSITTTSVVQSPAFNFSDPTNEEDWGELPKEGNQTSAIGSGFIISEDGYILTNQHVVNGASSVKVKINGFDKEAEAKVIGQDEQLDLAVLKVNVTRKLPVLTLGNSDELQVGEWAIAIGNPYGLDHSVTLGVISALDRSMSIENSSFTNLIQTDTPINPGNSGGPLLNNNGDVIGINTAINAEAQSIGFSIPIDTVEEVLDDLIQKGKISRPYLGVQIQSITEGMVQYYGLTIDEGVIVTRIVENSPAFKSGIELGDIILAVNGKKITTPDELVKNVQSSAIGEKVKLTINRAGKNQEVSVTLEGN